MHAQLLQAPRCSAPASHTTQLANPPSAHVLFRLLFSDSMAAVIKAYSKEELVARGLRSWLAPSTLTKVRRDTKHTLDVLRRAGPKTIIPDMPRFARTELGVTSCSWTMLRPADVVVSRIIMGDAFGPFQPGHRFLTQFVIAELGLREGIRSFRFFDSETATLRFQLRADGDFTPLFLLPSYFVSEIPEGESTLVAFFLAQQQHEADHGALPPIELAAPSIDRSITIRRAAGPVAAAPPAPRFLDLSPLSAAALSLCTIITGDRSRTSDEFLQALRQAGVTSAVLPSAPVRIESQAGFPLFAFYPASVACAVQLYYAIQDIASSAPAFVSFLPHPSDGKPHYELQQAVLVPISFLEHFPPGQAAPTLQRLLRTHPAFTSACIALGRDSTQQDEEHGRQRVVRVYFPSTAHFRIWARDFPTGVPVSISLDDGKQVCSLSSAVSFHPALLFWLPSATAAAVWKPCSGLIPLFDLQLWRSKTPSKSGQNMSLALL